MGKKLYVGNLPYSVTESGLQEMFAAIGEVTSVSIITDRDTGRPRGFAFVEMANDEDARKAIAELNGKSLDGRQLTVNEARPQEQRGSFGGSRGGSYGGGRSGGGRSGGSRGGRGW